MTAQAELSQEELEAAKRYMRVDDGGEDGLVGQLVLAARAYLAGAGIRLPEPGTARRAQYDLAAHALALSAYDQREMSVIGTCAADNPVMARSIVQLKLTEPSVSNLDTEGDGDDGEA